MNGLAHSLVNRQKARAQNAVKGGAGFYAERSEAYGNLPSIFYIFLIARINHATPLTAVWGCAKKNKSGNLFPIINCGLCGIIIAFLFFLCYYIGMNNIARVKKIICCGGFVVVCAIMCFLVSVGVIIGLSACGKTNPAYYMEKDERMFGVKFPMGSLIEFNIYTNEPHGESDRYTVYKLGNDSAGFVNSISWTIDSATVKHELSKYGYYLDIPQDYLIDWEMKYPSATVQPSQKLTSGGKAYIIYVKERAQVIVCYSVS